MRRWKAAFDGSYDPRSGLMSYAAVVHDELGRPVARRVDSLEGSPSDPGCRGPLQAEARGALLAVMTFRELTADADGRSSGRGFTLTGDCRELIHLLRSPYSDATNEDPCHADPVIQELLSEIRLLGGGRRCMRLRWVPRSGNRDADHCARLAGSGSYAEPGYVAQLPDGLVLGRDLITADLRGRQRRLSRRAAGVGVGGRPAVATATVR